jgi:tRNA (guanine37-N1)-methyltransferase
MHLTVVTIFPEIFSSFLATSLVGKAVEAGRIQIELVDPRDFTSDRHRSVDDTPYGGGEGMVMKVEPLVAALESIQPEGAVHRILLTPQGEPLSQSLLERLAAEEHLVLVCGRYEGFDERVRSYVDRELSLGDFVLNGGEVASMAIIDGVARLLPGVLGNAASLQTESHASGLLEYPQFTRPREFRGHAVPEVLLSGDHERIRSWRHHQMLVRTRQRRPDLWREHHLTAEERELLCGEEAADQADHTETRDQIAGLAARTYVVLLHHPVYDREGKVVATAITNLDLHDIARSCRTYGLAGYFVVTPLSAQQELAGRIVEHWRTGYGARYNPRRRDALALLEVEGDLEQVLARIEGAHGRRPITVVTSAVERAGQVSQEEVLLRAGASQPLVLVLGTGWGLAQEALEKADLALAPIWGATDYNHLSVRSAAAILLDRFFGLRD